MKIKKKKVISANIPEKGAATQEMEAIMDAAAADTEEIALLLDDGAPTEEAVSQHDDVQESDGIEDIPDALDEAPGTVMDTVPDEVTQENNTSTEEPADASSAAEQELVALLEQPEFRVLNGHAVYIGNLNGLGGFSVIEIAH